MTLNMRIFGIVAGAATAAVLVAGGMLGVQPQLAAAAAADRSTTQAEAQNQATQAKIVQLSTAFAKKPALEAQNADLQIKVPEILKPNRLVRRVNEVAALDNVSVQAVSTGTAIAYRAPATATVPGAVAAPDLAKTDARITAENFTAVPLTVMVAGTAAGIEQFSRDIQNDERSFAVNTYVTSADQAGNVTGTIGGFVYTLKR